MATALVNGRVLRDAAIQGGRCVLLEGERILGDRRRGRSALPRAPSARPRRRAAAARLHRRAGQRRRRRAVQRRARRWSRSARIGAAHRRFGTTGFLPTLISADLDTVARAIAAVRAAIEAGVPGVLGIHIEGPFLNVARKGVHDPAKLRELDPSALGLLTSLRGGRTLVTLAPEMTTPQIIAQLRRPGVIVSAGHTNATYAEMRAALWTTASPASRTCSTPCRSSPGASPARSARRSTTRDSWCGIIVDGAHTDPVVLRIALRCKPPRPLHAGHRCHAERRHGQRPSFVLQGRRDHACSGHACVDEDGRLAGSNSTWRAACATR